MKLRRRTLGEMKGQPRMQKALAIAILVKSRLDRTQTIKNYTISKISNLAGVSPTTIRKYMPILKNMGFVAFFGNNNQHITFKSLHSPISNRNVDAREFELDTLQNVVRSIQAYIALSIQAKREFIKRTIQTVANPKTTKELRTAREKVKRLVKKGILHDRYEKFKDFGISYEKFAQEIGVSKKTAIGVIAFAINKGWVSKQKNVEQVFAPKVNHRKVEGYTFSTNNNLYIVKANTYTLHNQSICCIQ